MTAVYIISAKGGPVKIGVAGDPKKRLVALRTGTPYPLSLAHVEEVQGSQAAAIEQTAHALLAESHVHGEWFGVSIEEAKIAVIQAVETIRLSPLTAKQTVVRKRSISCSNAFAIMLEETLGRQLDRICVERGFSNRFEATCALINDERESANR